MKLPDVKLPDVKLMDKMRQQKLLSTTLLLFTLSIGIVIGTLVNTGTNAARGQTTAPDATPLVVPKATPIGNEFTPLAKKLEPSVVNITADYVPKVTGKNRRNQPQEPDDGDDDGSDLFRRFFGGPGQGQGQGQAPPQAFKREQSGTGFIVDKNGYIVTNNHVVDGVDHIKVKLHGDSTEYRARLIGTDRETDLAVIKIDPKRSLTPVSIGNSDAVQVGDWAVAIGSPFGLEATVTAGIVSATGRDINAAQFQKFIQTDAAINPGNSGGPLLNIRGEVIGVNTMIATQSGGYQGVGFALPVNMVVRVYNDIIREGRVTRGSIGVTWQKVTKPETLKAMGFDHGVIVEEVKKGGPADKAGVHADDIILGINGQAVKDGDELMSRVADLPVGSQTTLNIDRDGKKMDMKLTILDRMEVFKDDPRVVGEVSVPDDAGKPAEATQARFGISIRPASDQERELTPEKHGVAVTRVEPSSFAEDIGMLERDIIVSINRQPVSSVDDIRRIQQTLKPGDPVAFRVVRSAPTQLRGRGVPASQSIFLSGTLPQN
jgi:serine protease Do